MYTENIGTVVRTSTQLLGQERQAQQKERKTQREQLFEAGT